jgi:hypothetical protein
MQERASELASGDSLDPPSSLKSRVLQWLRRNKVTASLLLAFIVIVVAGTVLTREMALQNKRALEEQKNQLMMTMMDRDDLMRELRNYQEKIIKLSANPTPVHTTVSPSVHPSPMKWGLVIVVLKNAGAASTTLEAMEAGLPNLAIFDHRGGADTVAQFADAASAKSRLESLSTSTHLAADSYVVEIRSWCKAAKYVGPQKILGKGAVPVFKCQDASPEQK